MSHSSRGVRRLTIGRWIFILGMLAFCVFMAWHTWTVADLKFQVQDVSLSLDTSRQREKKQQYEYDQVVAAIPETEAELACVQPEADEAMQAVTDLKAQRKELRAQRDTLAAELETAQTELTQAQEALAEAETARKQLEEEIAALQAEIAAY